MCSTHLWSHIEIRSNGLFGLKAFGRMAFTPHISYVDTSPEIAEYFSTHDRINRVLTTYLYIISFRLWLPVWVQFYARKFVAVNLILILWFGCCMYTILMSCPILYLWLCLTGWWWGFHLLTRIIPLDLRNLVKYLAGFRYVVCIYTICSH